RPTIRRRSHPPQGCSRSRESGPEFLAPGIFSGMKREEFLGKDAYAGRTLGILNPKAGQDDPARLRRMIGGAFAARCAPFDLVVTCGAGHAIELARAGARLGSRPVCVVGGDAPLAEAAPGLAGTNVPLGLIPLGT